MLNWSYLTLHAFITVIVHQYNVWVIECLGEWVGFRWNVKATLWYNGKTSQNVTDTLAEYLKDAIPL